MNTLRQQFPILQKKINGNSLVYFDNAATTQKPQAVIDAVRDFYEQYNSNVHRGINPLAEEATKRYEAARDAVRDFINANSRQEIIFTRGATEGINLIAQAWGRKNLKKGDRVIISVLEHHANFVPWLILKKELGIKIDVIPLSKTGYIDMGKARILLKQSKAKLLALSLCSNVLGGLEINAVKLLQKEAGKLGVKVLVDAAQAAGHFPIDVQKLNCDFLVFSGHKMFGPTGIGVLYARQDILEAMPVWQGGGEMIKEVFLDSFTANSLPHKFEAGTPNIAGAVGLGAAVDFIKSAGFKKIIAKEKELTDYFLKKIKEYDYITLYGTKSAKDKMPIFSLSVKGVHPHDAGDILGERGIILRAGHHCAQPLHNYLGVNATLRASLSFYNTKKEIDAFFKELAKMYKSFYS